MQHNYLVAASSAVVANVAALGDQALDTVIVRGWDNQRATEVDLLLLPPVEQALTRAHLLRSLRSVLRHPHQHVATALDSGVRAQRPFLVFAAQEHAQHGWQPSDVHQAVALLRQVGTAVQVLLLQGLHWAPLTMRHLRVDDQGKAQVIALPAQSTSCADEPAALLQLAALAHTVMEHLQASSAENTHQIHQFRSLVERLSAHQQPAINTLAQLLEELDRLETAQPHQHVSSAAVPLPDYPHPPHLDSDAGALLSQDSQPELIKTEGNNPSDEDDGCENDNPHFPGQLASDAMLQEGDCHQFAVSQRIQPLVLDADTGAVTGPVPVVGISPPVLRGGAVEPGLTPTMVKLSTLVAHTQSHSSYVGLDSLLRDYDPELDDPPPAVQRPAKRRWSRLLGQG